MDHIEIVFAYDAFLVKFLDHHICTYVSPIYTIPNSEECTSNIKSKIRLDKALEIGKEKGYISQEWNIIPPYITVECH